MRERSLREPVARRANVASPTQRVMPGRSAQRLVQRPLRLRVERSLPSSAPVSARVTKFRRADVVVLVALDARDPNRSPIHPRHLRAAPAPVTSGVASSDQWCLLRAGIGSDGSCGGAKKGSPPGTNVVLAHAVTLRPTLLAACSTTSISHRPAAGAREERRRLRHVQREHAGNSTASTRSAIGPIAVDRDEVQDGLLAEQVILPGHRVIEGVLQIGGIQYGIGHREAMRSICTNGRSECREVGAADSHGRFRAPGRAPDAQDVPGAAAQRRGRSSSA